MIYLSERILMAKTNLVKNSITTNDKVKRAPIRYKPDPMTIAHIDFENAKEFKPSCVGIVINESYSGCSVVISTDIEIKRGDKVKIKIGELSAMKANVAWVKELEENIYKLGIQLLD